MSSERLSFDPAIVKTTGQGIVTTSTMIAEEASGLQYGLYSRYHRLNRAMLKYFRFGNVSLLAGRSGSCKSFFLNFLRTDFLDVNDVIFNPSKYINYGDTEGIPVEEGTMVGSVYYPDANLFVLPTKNVMRYAINKRCEYETVLIHFSPEMSIENELVRSISNIIGTSYGYLMSSSVDDMKKPILLSEHERDYYDEILDTFKGRREYFIDRSVTIPVMNDIVDWIANSHPNCKLIITLDHTLLMKKDTVYSNDDAIIDGLAMTAIKFKQEYNAMVVFLNQLNNKIEENDRIRQPALHYPGKKDIFYIGKLWNACDNVMILHRPEQLGIAQYGVDKLHTFNLLHGNVVKSRFGDVGDIFFRTDLSSGRIHEAEKVQFLLK